MRFELLREADAAALLTLVCEVTELPADKTLRRTHVLNRLLEVLGGRSAVVFEQPDPDEGPLARAGTVININTTCPAESQAAERYLVHNDPEDPAIREFRVAHGQTITMVRETDDDREWYRSDHFDVVRGPFDIDHSLYCRLTTPDGQDLTVRVQRSPADPAFTERERALVHLLHTHAPRVYHAPVPTPPELGQLPPRVLPVLRSLMQGDSEKEVAAKLKLSRHTVHRYAQTIYRELNLNSRAELMAKYARFF
jgi:DNA-binding CsgD family transcriptional regulator